MPQLIKMPLLSFDYRKKCFFCGKYSRLKSLREREYNRYSGNLEFATH